MRLAAYTAATLKRRIQIGLTALLAMPAGGCVERTLTIASNPPGALVYLNDQEVGRTPVTREFVWYGNYDLAIRRDGYQTLKTTVQVNAPIFQIVPLDLVAELLPFHFVDAQHFSYNLAQNRPVDERQLMLSAEEMKRELEPSRRQTPLTKPATQPAPR